MKWFEAVKSKIVPTVSLSHFFEVKHARKVKAVEEIVREDTQTFAIKSKYQFRIYVREDTKFITSYTQEKV